MSEAWKCPACRSICDPAWKRCPYCTNGDGRRYWVGYYCPRGSGHYEIYGQPEYTPECGSKGWNVYLDAEEGDEYLPEGEWR